MNLPASIAEKIAPGYAHFRAVSRMMSIFRETTRKLGYLKAYPYMQQCAGWIKQVQQRRQQGIFSTADGRSTVFDMLLEPNPEKDYRVPGSEELIDQGFLFLVAGSDTTAYSLACATYYILTHAEVLERLRTELRQDFHRTVVDPDWNYINKLPYLVKTALQCVAKGSPSTNFGTRRP